MHPDRHLGLTLSERDQAILSRVQQFRFLRGDQLERLHFSGEHQTRLSAQRSCRRVLARLVDLRLLSRLDQRSVGGLHGGSASFIYALGPLGHRLLDDGHQRRGWREPSQTFLLHTLAVADVFATVITATRETSLQLLRYETEPTSWRQIADQGDAETLRPDLLVVLGSDGLDWHWWIEVDRGTEHLPAIRRKCRQYLSYYRDDDYQAVHGVFPLVAWLTTTPKRAANLQEAVARQNASLPLFKVGLLADPLTTLLSEETPS
jgi:hypothetical protein